jgi:hypothetical protein
MRKIFWPSAMAQSSFVFTKAFAWQQLNGLTTALGFKATSETPPIRPQSQNVNLQDGKERRPLPPPTTKQPANGTTAHPATSDSKAPPRPRPEGGESDGSMGLPSGAKPSRETESPARDFIPDHVQNAVKGPWQEFQKTLAQKWAPTMDYPPRGCIYLSGMVELETEKAFAVIDVYAWWDPATKKFDQRSMYLHLRRFQYKQQAPLRR